MPADPRTSPRPATPHAREPGVLLEDLARDLLWTRVLRAPAYALRPGRIAMGMAGALIAALIGSIHFGDPDQPRIGELVSSSISASLSDATTALTRLDAGAFVRAVGSLAFLPSELIQNHPWATLLLAAPMAVVLALFGGAIARASSVEFTSARFTEWPADLRASLGKLGASAAALLAPLALAGVIVLLIASGGVLLGVPVLDVVGAVLYAVAMAGAFIAFCILILHALALPMIVPAIIIEGTDSFDAIQRCYAYVLARPLHLLAHAALLLILGALSIGLFAMVAGNVDAMTAWAATRFTTEAGTEVVQGLDTLNATQPAAHAIIGFWRALLELAVSGFAISYFFTAGSILYLVARRICDGQSVNEMWDPADESA